MYSTQLMMAVQVQRSSACRGKRALRRNHYTFLIEMNTLAGELEAINDDSSASSMLVLQ